MVQVASVNTLVRRLDKIRNHPDIIIVDEGHHISAGMWLKIKHHFNKARILGVTATPCRLDGKGLGDHYDKMIVGPSTRDMIAGGYLVKPMVYSLGTPGILEPKKAGNDYQLKSLADIYDNKKIIGDVVGHYEAICPKEPAIAFCVNIRHAENVAARFRDAGYKFHSIDGKTDDRRREFLIKSLADGSIHGLTSCEIISEGTDIPRVTAAILLRKTMSLAKYLQQVGRVLRPVYADGFDLSTLDGRIGAIRASEKPYAIILDHVGNYAQPGFGLPDADREWVLEKSTGVRKGAEKDNGDPEERARQCPKCFRVHEPSPACPFCGHEYPVALPEETSGTLSLISTEDVIDFETVRAKRIDVSRRLRDAISLRDFQDIARDTGYKPGWAWYQWNKRMK